MDSSSKDLIQTVTLVCTSVFTFGILVVSGIRAWIEWKTYKTEWWEAHKSKPPTI